MSSHEKHPKISEADFLDLVKINLKQWIALRGVDPVYGRMGFESKVVDLWRSSLLGKVEFRRRLFDALRVICEFQNDEQVASAFLIPEEEQPHDDAAANADIEAKREESRRLLETADREERQRAARAYRISELRGQVPRLQEEVEYFENVLPGELRAEIERCRAAVLQNCYSTSPYASVGPRAKYIVSMDAQIIAAERALAEHPERMKKVQDELRAAKEELANLEREHRKANKRKTAA